MAMASAEFLAVVLCGLGAALFSAGTAPGESIMERWPLVVLVGSGLVAAFTALRLYRIRRLLHPGHQLTRIGFGAFAAFIPAIAILTAGGAEQASASTWLALWLGATFPLLLAFRFAASSVAGRWNGEGQFDRHAVFVGGGEPAARLITALRNSPDTHIAVGGIFDDRDDVRSPPLIEGLHKLGNISELVDFVRRARVDLLLVTLPLAAEERLLQILKQLWVLPVDIRLSAYTQKLRYRPRAYSHLGNVPFLDVFDRPLGEWGGIIKALEDRIIAGLVLILMAPLMVLIAVAVKLESRGPIFFKQKRYGFNNELIEVFKFRSMYDEKRDPDASKLVTKGDPRVTRVGRFIRRASLDELPQLINVLKGDLSLVGPRPHPTRARAGDQLYNDVVDGYFARHKVKPGITGWAQINGWRGETDTAEKLQRRVEHDLYYIENWSMRFDLKILSLTPAALFKGENAY
ncbi:MAG: undecaprenyl-phosphate glucose phosphotransferase [Rhizobiales bacterium]|nr:undecaprenyl-phosphate glucose phosphotransferase [Hyphomicrobiales bacterium]